LILVVWGLGLFCRKSFDLLMGLDGCRGAGGQEGEGREERAGDGFPAGRDVRFVGILMGMMVLSSWAAIGSRWVGTFDIDDLSAPDVHRDLRY